MKTLPASGNPGTIQWGLHRSQSVWLLLYLCDTTACGWAPPAAPIAAMPGGEHESEPAQSCSAFYPDERDSAGFRERSGPAGILDGNFQGVQPMVSNGFVFNSIRDRCQRGSSMFRLPRWTSPLPETAHRLCHQSLYAPATRPLSVRSWQGKGCTTDFPLRAIF